MNIYEDIYWKHIRIYVYICVLQIQHGAATYCNTPQHTATLQQTVAHCNTCSHLCRVCMTHNTALQHTATRAATHCNTSCNTLQHVFIFVCVCTTYIMMLQTLQLSCSCVAMFCSVLQLYILRRTHVHISAAFIFFLFFHHSNTSPN